jgi:hypothetical protein
MKFKDSKNRPKVDKKKIYIFEFFKNNNKLFQRYLPPIVIYYVYHTFCGWKMYWRCNEFFEIIYIMSLLTVFTNNFCSKIKNNNRYTSLEILLVGIE